MTDVLPGCNTATYLSATRGLAMDMAIQAIGDRIEEITNTQIVQHNDYWVAGTMDNPEMFQIFYHSCSHGSGWVFDAIP